MLGRLAINDIITFEDAEGRFVVYDGRDVNHSGVVDPYKLKNFTELVMSSGSAVIAGNGNDTLYGTNYSNDELYGGKGNDYLDGREGADRMLGGAGDDIYVVDDEGDVVIEQAGEGVDLVRSSVTHTLGENVENLRLTGEGNIDGSGNSLDNEITGNSGNNFIRGGRR